MIDCGLATVRALLRLRGQRLLLVSAGTLLTVGASSIVVEAPSARRQMVTATVFYGGLALTWSLVAGWLGRELRSGSILQWAQLPVSIVVVYALRFTMAAGTALLLAGLQAAVVGVFVQPAAPADATHLLAGLPGMLLVYLVFSGLVWTLGGWGVVGDGWAALLLALELSVLELMARLRPEWLGPAAGPLDIIGLPLDDLGLSASLLSDASTGTGAALIRVMAWLAGCATLGALGIRCRPLRPPMAD